MKSNQIRIEVLVSCLLGALVFWIIYGHEILSPTFLQWTMHGDPAQHFLGWHFFRFEPWQWPLGVIQSLEYPQGTSLVYTDSIPLLAIPFKLISTWLPPVFQYHGLWLLLCYVLQGYFAYYLFRHITSHGLLIFLGVLFFLWSPTIVQRAEQHEALSAHWLITAGLLLFLRRPNLSNHLKWLMLLLVAILVHFYLFSMVLALFAAYCLKIIIEDYRQSIWVLLMAAGQLASVLGMMWVVGYFVIDVGSGDAFGYGHYSMNLVALWDPAKTSSFLKPFALATNGQYEGYNYLGLGALLLLVIAIYEVLRANQTALFIRSHVIPLAAMALGLGLLSLSSKVTWGEHVLLDMNFPAWLEYLTGIFRSSGRMFWPVGYVLILFAFTVVVRRMSSRSALATLVVLFSLQCLDLWPWYQRQNYQHIAWQSPLKSPVWNDLMARYQHIAFFPANRDQDDYVPFAQLAANHQRTINVAYTARHDQQARYEYNQTLLQQVKAGKFDSHTLYVIKPGYEHLLGENAAKKDRIRLDGYHLFAPNLDESLQKQASPWSQDNLTWPALMQRYNRKGYLIAVAVKDEAVANLSQMIKDNLKKQGSRIEQLQYRGSYAAIWHNGGLKKEDVNNNSSANVTELLQNQPLEVRSSGFSVGDRASITWNGREYSPNQRGFNIVVINLVKGEVIRYVMDSHKTANALAIKITSP